MKRNDLSALQATLSADGFVHIPELIELLPEAMIDTGRFQSHWDVLVLDENFKTYTNRYRRILRFFYTHPRELKLNPDNKYVPTVTYDVAYKQGANELSYATQAFIDDPLISEIIDTDLSLIDNCLEDGCEYMLDIDLFRVSSTDGRVSPTTSGRHQDGQDWLFMHFIASENTEPVVSEVARSKEARETLFRHSMNGFLETLCVNDRKLWHAASPVRQHDLSKPAYRDLLLVSVVRKVPDDQIEPMVR